MRVHSVCDDGNLCTIADSCSAGVCTGAVDPCDDGDACTSDFCDAVSGCRHEPSCGDEPSSPKPKGGCAAAGRSGAGSAWLFAALAITHLVQSRRRRRC